MASCLPPLIVILGPTASGKTDLAVELAKEFDGEIINADSRQVYKEIDIASAKPKFQKTKNVWALHATPLRYHGVPHHLFDVVAPYEAFDITHFKQLALATINDIHARRHLPFLVGGTGLWISAIVENLSFPEVPPNITFRLGLDITSPARANSPSILLYGQGTALPLPTAQLYQRLISQDPEAAQFIDSKNRRRIIRALEVIEATGVPFSIQRKKGAPLFRVLPLGMTKPMKELEERIATRLDTLMQEGLDKEARYLFSTYNPSLPALSSIGIREWQAYFNGSQTHDETLRLILLHTRQYAKRQMTWFKRDKRVQWIQNKNEAAGLIHNFLQS